MNRAMMRASKKIGASMMKLNAGKFEEISWREISMTSVKNKPDRAWKNNHYIVQLYRKERVIFGITMDKLMIRRNDAEPIRDWYTLQNIKNEILGKEHEAIQIFPKDSELVDVANMYWLFCESGQL